MGSGREASERCILWLILQYKGSFLSEVPGAFFQRPSRRPPPPRPQNLSEPLRPVAPITFAPLSFSDTRPWAASLLRSLMSMASFMSLCQPSVPWTSERWPAMNCKHCSFKASTVIHVQETGGVMFREYCFGRENSMRSATNVLRQTQWVWRRTPAHK